jgi:hypothetical protein
MSTKMIVARLVRRIREEGGWGSRTAIQKNLYALRTLFPRVETAEYLFYKHGVYSFELDEAIAEMVLTGELQREETRWGGRYDAPAHPRYEGEAALPGELEPALDFVARKLAGFTARQLEALTTVMYVATDESEREYRFPPEALLRRVSELKPHLSGSELQEALQTWGTLQAEAQAIAVPAQN